MSTEPYAPPRCYVHGDRTAGSLCRRCNRPICPECMREAPVGWQCPSCVQEAARQSPVVRWRPSRRPGGLGATRITQMVTALIGVNIAAYLWQSASPRVEERFAMWPIGVHDLGQWYRLVTAAFLHANGEHILFNMITLAIVGPPVEALLGRVRFVLLYLLAAVGGSVGTYLFTTNPDIAGVGASGAIFGLMGAYLVLAWLEGWEVRSILVLIGVNLLIGFSSPIIDWRAHLGGLVTGILAAAGYALRPGAMGRRRPAGGTARPTTVSLVVQTVAVTIAGATLLGVLVQLPPGRLG